MDAALPSTYHVWFATKRRHWLMVGETGEAGRVLLMDAAREKNIAMLECQTIVDHVHMLVQSKSTAELSWALKLLKGRSSYELSRRFPELKLDGRVQSIWQRGFGKRLVPPDEVEIVRRYIQTQNQRLAAYER
jgi:putative transposase